MELQNKVTSNFSNIKQSLLLQIDELEKNIQQDRKVMTTIDEKLDAEQSELVESSSELERLEGRKLFWRRNNKMLVSKYRS